MKRHLPLGRQSNPVPHNDQQDEDIPTMNVWTSPYKAHIPHMKTIAVEEDAQKTLSKMQHSLTNKPADKRTSMQVVARTYLFLGQIFGLLPVCGFSSDYPNDLRFSWKAKRVIFTSVLLFTGVVMFILQIVGAALITGFNYSSIDSILSFSIRMTQVAIFLVQAQTWPKLILDWTKIEEKMKHFHPIDQMPKMIKIYIFTFCIGGICLITARILGPLGRVIDCSDDPSTLVQLTFLILYTSLYSPPGLSVFKPIAVAALFMQECVVTVYDELTIVILAYCLFLRFRQINQHVLKVHRQRIPVTYWTEVRETYNDLSQLTKHVDAHLSRMTLVCFGSNLYEICSLLHKIISPIPNKLAKYSIIYELLFTMLRTFFAAVMASSVKEESKKPLPLLFSVPSNAYNGEIARFQMQVTHDDIALTGSNFFSVTRSFMLTVAGTIATYEIVLLQFGDADTGDGARNRSQICSDIIKLYPLVY